MKLMKMQLLLIAFVLLISGSAFASLSYEVSVDTSGLAGTSGYLYLQYTPLNAVASTATVSGFTMNGGSLGAQDTVDVVNGSAVTGSLPSTVVFANTNGVNDYNHAITFGSALNFLLTFSNPVPGGTSGGVSTFSLGLFADAFGGTPLINVNGGNYAGTGVMVNLNNDASTSVQSLDGTANATATPIPAAAWLLGSGLAGLVGIRRKVIS